MTLSGKVYVVDDDESVRSALSRLLRSEGLDVEAFATAEAFLEHPRPDEPGCLVLDVQMPGLTGLDLQRALAESGAELPIVFMTAHGDIPMSVRAMKEGAVDFLPKPVESEVLLATVRGALEKGAVEHDREHEIRTFRNAVERLTPREHEVLALVVAGHLNKQIAARLGISLVTVKVHRGRGMEKTGVDSLAELARLWERAGLALPDA